MTQGFKQFLPHKKKRSACVLAGPFYNILDHGAPLAALLDIPLISYDETIVFKFKRFYPDLTCRLRAQSLAYLIENFSTIFYGFNVKEHTFKELIKISKEQDRDNPLWKYPTKWIYHLHGCSDKHWFQGKGHLLDVDQILLSGQRMIDLFDHMSLLKKIKAHAVVGNYRKSYYLKHQQFYDSLTEREIFSQFQRKQFTILYAPTWMDGKKNCSFFEIHHQLLKNLPDEFNLLIKLHPHLNFYHDGYNPKNLAKLLGPFYKKPNIVVAPLFPPVYPILKQVDAYLGDYSSVGYDALSFNLPLFFINHHDLHPQRDPTAFLLRCGYPIAKDEYTNIYSIIAKCIEKDRAEKGEIKAKTYEYAFGQDQDAEAMKQSLKSLLL